MNADAAFDAELSRRRFLRHAAWAGAGVAVTVSGGVLTSKVLHHGAAAAQPDDFTFVQVSDSHIGFTGPANTDVTATFQSALDLVNALPARPDFVVHTGDLTHYSTPDQFDQVKQMLSTLRTGQVLIIPGEHDSTDDAGQKYRKVFGAGTRGDGWFSLDHRGVHFVGLVNTVNLQKLGHLGREQIDWLKRDLRSVSSETPLVVFSHMPLFAMYPDWGWGTDDATEALSHMRRFGSVTVLNGHVHQLMKKVEGNITFHTAMATAYPLPHSGDGPAPKPVVVAPDRLHEALGIRQAHILRGPEPVAIIDEALPETQTAHMAAELNRP